MNIEDLRDYCLSLENAEETFPFVGTKELIAIK